MAVALYLGVEIQELMDSFQYLLTIKESINQFFFAVEMAAFSFLWNPTKCSFFRFISRWFGPGKSIFFFENVQCSIFFSFFFLNCVLFVLLFFPVSVSNVYLCVSCHACAFIGYLFKRCKHNKKYKTFWFHWFSFLLIFEELFVALLVSFTS